MKKVFLHSALIVVILCVFILSACNADSDIDSNNSGKEALTEIYTVGVNTWGSAPILQLYGDEAKYALQTIGMKYESKTDDYNPDQEISNIKSFIQEGADALCVQGAGVTTVPQIGDEAKNAKIPFVLCFFIGAEEDRADLAANNEYYAGAVASDLIADGKVLGEKAIADGARTACIIGGNYGDLNMNNRSEGFRKAFEAGGGTILAEERCVDRSECEAKAEDMLSANKDVDAIYIMAGDYVEGTLAIADKLGMKDAKSYLSSVNPSSAVHILSGRIVAGSGGAALSGNIAPALLLNMLDGHPIKDPDGNAPLFEIPTTLVTAENVDAYVDVFYNEDRSAVTEDIVKNLCYRFNDKVDYQLYVDTIKNDLTVDAIINAAQKNN